VNGSGDQRPRPPAMRGQPYLWLALFLLGVALFRQYGVSGFGDPDLVNTWLFYCVIVVGFYLVFGLSGQFAFSQAVFAAIGAYTSAWATRIALFGDSFWMGVLVAIVVTAVVAAAFALLVRRASHFYFAIATLGLSEIVLEVLRKWTEFSGATGDTTAGIRHISLFGYPLDNPYRIFWVWFGALALVLLITIFLARSPVQREAIATRDQDVVAATLGVAILRSRITMFVLGSTIAGVGGAIFAHSKGFATPDSFGIDLGLGIFVMLILGGIDSRWGPIVGAAFYVFVPQWLQGGVLGIPGVDFTVNAFGQEHHLGDFRDLFFGALLVIVMIAFPEGLVGIGRRVRSLLLGRAHPARRTWLSDFFGLTPKKPPVAEGQAEIREPGMAPPSPVETGAGDGAAPQPTSAPVLEADDIRVQFGGVQAVDGASLAVHENEILGLVGPNGSGKTTFLNALSGVVSASGSLRVRGRPVQLGRAGRVRALAVVRTYQSPQTYEHLTCIDDVLLSTADRHLTGISPACVVRPALLRRDRARWDTAVRALDRVGLIELAEEPTARLSYGQRRLLELARAINAQPQTLLLDEPSAGLDSAETEQLGAHLQQLQDEGVSMLLVDHKLDFITSLCDRVAVLELGRLVAVGPSATVFEDQRVVDAYLGVDEEVTSRA
jgi:ABC-type branched-subunit amino acid transport system ATPase component/ABC-type branched-subunit amino acid transport system permease subunit